MRDDTKNDCEGDYNNYCSFFHAWSKLRETVSKRPVRLLILFQMEEDISPNSLNVTAESSSKFKLVVNSYGCFVESDEHNEGHKLRNV